MSPEEIVATTIRLIGALAPVVAQALQGGDTSTLEALRAVVSDPEAMAAFDDAVVASQRAKARAELAP